MHDFFSNLSIFTAGSGLPAVVVLVVAVVAAVVVFTLVKRLFGFVSGLVFAGIATGAISVSQLAAPVMEAIGR